MVPESSIQLLVYHISLPPGLLIQYIPAVPQVQTPRGDRNIPRGPVRPPKQGSRN